MAKAIKNKSYSLPEPDVLCIGKGKAHKKDKFGRKASIAVTKTTGVTVGAMFFTVFGSRRARQSNRRVKLS